MNTVEKEVNEFLSNLPNLDIDHIDVIPCADTEEGYAINVGVFIWLKTTYIPPKTEKPIIEQIATL